MDRVLLWAGLSLLSINLGVLVTFTGPRLLQGRSLALQAKFLESEIARVKRDVEEERKRQSTAEANAKDVERLYHDILGSPRRAIVPVLEELDRCAKEVDLLEGTRIFQEKPLKGAPLVRMAITVPLHGRYSHIVNFLEKVEQSKRFFVVDQIALHSERGEEGELRIELSTYFFGGDGA